MIGGINCGGGGPVPDLRRRSRSETPPSSEEETLLLLFRLKDVGVADDGEVIDGKVKLNGELGVELIPRPDRPGRPFDLSLGSLFR